jgi:putative ABC transport system permease protein
VTPLDEGRARRVYRALLKAWPEAYRVRYGREMEDAFLALLRLAGERRGRVGRVHCWVGAALDAAVRGTAERFGSGHALREHTMATGGGDMVGAFLWDVRYAVRSLRRRPLFAVTAILTIALGIGANASVFTVSNAFLFAPLPYDHPDRLVTLWAENDVLGYSHSNVSPADAWDWRSRTHALQDLAVYTRDGLNLTGAGDPELVQAVRVTPNIFSLLGREPSQGRAFLDGEVGQGRDNAVILTDGYWVRRFGADPRILGSSLVLDGRTRTVVGVMPPDFRFLEAQPDLFLPLDQAPADAPRDGHYASAIARLAVGATLDGAQDELTGVARALEAEHPDTNRGWTVRVYSTHDELVGDVARQASIVLLGAVALILLMACVNVANLLLARAAARSREMAVRAALGAGRRRVVHQLLTESLVLATAGGALGLLAAGWGYRAIVAALPSNLPPVFRFRMDGHVLLFVVGVTVLSALIFGLMPAVRGAGAEMDELRESGRLRGGRRTGRLGGTLVVLQTAMSVVLLVGGGLLMKSIAAMRHQDFGFDADHVLTMRLAPPSASYPESDDLRAFWRQILDRTRQVPGVVAAGTTQSHPLMGSNWGNTIYLQGPDGSLQETSVHITYGSPGLFEALRFRMVLGRTFGAADMEADAPLVAIVNEAFVRRYLGEGADPLRAPIMTDEAKGKRVAIVGVVHDVVERGVDKRPEPTMYAPDGLVVTRTRSLVVRTVGAPEEATDAIERAVWSVDPNIPPYSVETLAALVNRRIGGFSVIGYLMGTLALMSLVLGAVGIYGVTAYAVGQRSGEIGLRIAMGAQRGDVVRMVVLQGGRRAVLGLALGIPGALGLSGGLRRVLVGVSPSDPTTFACVTLLLATVSVLGLWLPARRAARVDPVRALSAE